MKQRDSNLDVIRALAAFCVVVNHAAESVYSMSMEQYQMIPHSSSAFYFAAFTFGRCGVPLFLLLSGYLLLPQSYDENKIKRFYKHNFLPMLGVWELWIFIYCVFLAWYYQMPFDVAQYIRRALFLEHAGLSHTWYMNVSVFAVCGERVEANTLDAVVDHDACCVCVPFHSSECEFVSVDAANSIE